MSIDDKKVKTLCEDLEKEPLLHMSLHSMELFHSDFLAWFANSFPEQAAAVFLPWTVPMAGAQAGRSERESNHLDLVLHLPDLAPIVVENKVFSVPDEEQLDRYADVLAEREAKGSTYTRVLLSLISPGWATYNGWQLLSYRELAKALRPQVVPIRAADAFAGALVEHYVVLINRLVDLFEFLGTPASDEPLLLNHTVKGYLQQVRISAGVQKARASCVARELRNAVKNKGWSGIRVDDKFSQRTRTSLLEGFCYQGGNGSDLAGDALGWQIQDEQYRLVVITSRLPQREREAYVTKRYLDWFDFTLLGAVTGAHVVRSGRKNLNFQGYDPNFVYRYCKTSQLTPSQIVELGLLYLDRARQVFITNGGSAIPLVDDECNRVSEA